MGRVISRDNLAAVVGQLAPQKCSGRGGAETTKQTWRNGEGEIRDKGISNAKFLMSKTKPSV